MNIEGILGQLLGLPVQRMGIGYVPNVEALYRAYMLKPQIPGVNGSPVVPSGNPVQLGPANTIGVRG